jgi:hypothetical protein
MLSPSYDLTYHLNRSRWFNYIVGVNYIIDVDYIIDVKELLAYALEGVS